ncbi:MAG: PhzF family phenazine biosynthesis protein [Candidatus Limnocylindrales bacterium]
MTEGTLLRLAAFTTDPAGGNPAGVWIGDVLPAADEMQRIAAEVGYSETAFLAPDVEGEAAGAPSAGAYRVRYFSPLAEVPFCGHATIASGVGLAGRGAPEDVTLRTNDGVVGLRVVASPSAAGPLATLTSVATWVQAAPTDLLDSALGLLDWRPDELDPSLPPAVAFAGTRHLIIAVRKLGTLQRMAYPFDPMQALMLKHDLTTLQLVWRAGPTRFHARDPFAVGGLIEDPATGAAAAALGAYLRERGEITAPASPEGTASRRRAALVDPVPRGGPCVE